METVHEVQAGAVTDWSYGALPTESETISVSPQVSFHLTSDLLDPPPTTTWLETVVPSVASGQLDDVKDSETQFLP